MILKASNLRKVFKSPKPVEILSAISLEIEKGESIAITGKSGAGKTTLLHILATLEAFDSGTLCIKGKTVSQLENVAKFRNRFIGFIFQAFNLLEDFTALENVLMPSRIARQPLDSSWGIDLLSRVGLEDRIHYPAKHLSGGERQRVAIARALCNDPDLIFADEPSGNLDYANAEAISHLLFDLVSFSSKTLVLVTHDQDLAARCDRRFCLSQGQLII